MHFTHKKCKNILLLFRIPILWILQLLGVQLYGRLKHLVLVANQGDPEALAEEPGNIQIK